MRGYLLFFILFFDFSMAFAQEHPVPGNTGQPVGFIQTKKANGPITPIFFYLTPYKTRNNGSFTKDACLISFSYGFPTAFSESEIGFSYDFYYNTHRGFGPLSFRLEVGVRDDAGIAAFTQCARKKWTGNFNDGRNSFDGDLRVHNWGIGILGVYHFNKHIPLRNLDVYTSMGGGIFFDSWATKNKAGAENFQAAKTIKKFLTFGGIRYYLNRHYGFFMEAGRMGYSVCNFGTSIIF